MRIVAYFASPREVERAGRAAERAGWRIVTTCAPAYNEMVVDAAHATRSPVANAALAGGLVGAAFGVFLTVGTTLEWPARIISGKPVLPAPPFLIIVFELAILGTSIACIWSFLSAAAAARRAARAAGDARTSDDSLSLLLESDAVDAAPLDDLLRQSAAVAWRGLPE